MGPFNEKALLKAIKGVPWKAQLAFALSCAERLYPNYLAFVKQQSWGEPSVLRAALDLGWSVLEGHASDLSDLKSLGDAVQRAEPETEDFDTILVSSALDAAASAGLVLQFLKDRNARVVVEIATLCRDTVDMFVQDVEGLTPSQPNFEEKILKHDLMQRELQRQHADLEELRNFTGTAEETARLKAKWRDSSSGSIDQTTE